MSENIEERLTEAQALEWLKDRRLGVSLRTLREMRARKEVGFFKLPRGRNRIRFTRAQLMEAFSGEEFAPKQRKPRTSTKPRSSRLTDRLKQMSAER